METRRDMVARPRDRESRKSALVMAHVYYGAARPSKKHRSSAASRRARRREPACQPRAGVPAASRRASQHAGKDARRVLRRRWWARVVAGRARHERELRAATAATPAAGVARGAVAIRDRVLALDVLRAIRGAARGPPPRSMARRERAPGREAAREAAPVTGAQRPGIHVVRTTRFDCRCHRYTHSFQVRCQLRSRRGHAYLHAIA